MTELSGAEVQELRAMIDRAQIAELSSRYSRAVDRLDADLLRSVYWPDGTDDHGAYGECHWTGWYRFRQGDDVVDQVSNGRYLDRYERRNGEWRIQHRTCVSDWNRSGVRE